MASRKVKGKASREQHGGIVLVAESIDFIGKKSILRALLSTAW